MMATGLPRNGLEVKTSKVTNENFMFEIDREKRKQSQWKEILITESNSESSNDD